MQVMVTNLVSILAAQCFILGGQVTGVDSGGTERQQRTCSSHMHTSVSKCQQDDHHRLIAKVKYEPLQTKEVKVARYLHQ